MTRIYSWTKSRDDDAASRPGARPEKNFDSDKMHTWSRKVVHGRPTPVHVRQGILHVPGEGQHELLGLRGLACFVLEISSARTACAGKRKYTPGAKSVR